jgi:hypothetical protein
MRREQIMTCAQTMGTDRIIKYLDGHNPDHLAKAIHGGDETDLERNMNLMTGRRGIQCIFRGATKNS